MTLLDSFDTHFSPKDYLDEFYPPDQINADELVAVRAQIDFCRKFLRDRPLVLEFGAGPTAHRVIAVAPYVAAVHVAEYLPRNLAEIELWVQGRAGQHRWDLYAAYALQCEGVHSPTARQIEDRLALARSKVTRLFTADAGRQQPLGAEQPGPYAHVYSGFCADSATADKETWRRYMRNIASLVADGGTFWTAALHRATSYSTGPRRFPSADVDVPDVRAVLERDFLATTITIELRELAQMRAHGYAGIILAHAQKGLPGVPEPATAGPKNSGIS